MMVFRHLWCVLVLLPIWAMAANDDLLLLGNTLNLHGRIIDQPCVISPESVDQTVDMGTVDVRDLYSAGGGKQVPFVIRLHNCKPGVFKAAKVTFSGTADPTLKGALAFNSGSARGAAIRLYDSQVTPLDLQKPSRGYVLGNSTANELQFFARVEGYPDTIAAKTIRAGDYSAVASFVIAYE